MSKMKKADITRLNILEKAFELIYVKGYQATSVDDILATTAVTKGAFYYHFRNKDEMGLAIINEVLKPRFSSGFLNPLQNNKDPLKAIYDMMHGLLMTNSLLKVEHGCPASNLTQEMAPWNEAFREALDTLTNNLEKTLIAILEKGKKERYVREDVNSRQASLFILSGYWGVRNLGKVKNSRSVYVPYLKELKRYLDSMK
jgi:TetR/AcrR family transcriptional regulator, transcriptional repressor for nem operon